MSKLKKIYNRGMNCNMKFILCGVKQNNPELIGKGPYNHDDIIYDLNLVKRNKSGYFTEKEYSTYELMKVIMNHFKINTKIAFFTLNGVQIPIQENLIINNWFEQHELSEDDSILIIPILYIPILNNKNSKIIKNQNSKEGNLFLKVISYILFLNKSIKIKEIWKSFEIIFKLIRIDKIIFPSKPIPKLIAGSIFYIYSKSLRKNISFSKISEKLGYKQSKSLGNYYRKYFRTEFNHLIEESTNSLLFQFLKTLNIPNYARDVAKLLLNNIKNDERLKNKKNRLVAGGIIYILMEVCNELQKRDKNHEFSIINTNLNNSYYIAQLFTDYIGNLIPYLDHENFDILKLKILSTNSNLEKTIINLEDLGNILKIPKICINFARDLIISLNCSEYEIKTLEVRNLAASSIYFSIIFYCEYNYEDVNSIQDKIKNILSIKNFNSIYNKFQKLKDIYKKESLNQVKNYINILNKALNYNSKNLHRSNILLDDIFNIWWDSKALHDYYKFSVAISAALVFISSILSNQINKEYHQNNFLNKFNQIIKPIQKSFFKKKIFDLLRIVKDEDFIIVIAHIFKYDIFPKVNTKERIVKGYAPMFNQIQKHFPEYRQFIIDRNYTQRKSIGYREIISNLGMKDMSELVHTKKLIKSNKKIQNRICPKLSKNIKSKLKNYPKKLLYHLEEITKISGFPDYIITKYGKCLRISNFKLISLGNNNRENRHLRLELSNKLISEKKIVVINKNQDIRSKNNIEFIVQKLIDLAQTHHYNKNELMQSHQGPEHNKLLLKILDMVDNAIGIELNVWKPYKDTFLTGHIDLLLIYNRTLIVADYKPDESPLEGHFLKSIPQLASYAYLIREEFKIEKILCVSFNNKGAWIFSPDILFNEIKLYLKSINFKKIPWEKYFEK
ncbi:MAG: hypothetical protein JXA99_08890 [Candidatus Lokiarchaeota archaeon]|nr:hypothetical protein [Candidatus Lokiarchaeota archaeon]